LLKRDGKLEPSAQSFSYKRFVVGFLLAGSCLLLVVDGRAGEGSSQLRVRRIHVEGNHLLSEKEILSSLNTQPGKPFRESVFERDVERLLAFYENNGYPFCQIKPRDFLINGGVSFVLEIREGPLVTIDSIRVIGNRITKRDVIVRELRLRLPSIYDQRVIDGVQNRLNRTGLFEKTLPPQIYYDAERQTGILVVQVHEAKTNRVGGVVGYVPATSGQKGYLTGLVDLSFQNILGTGRRAEARWSREGPSASELRLSYREPWVFGFPVDIGGSLSQRQQVGFTRTHTEVFLMLPISPVLSGEVSIGWERVIPDSAGGESMAKSKGLSGEVRVRLDTRDHPANPTSGVFSKVSVKFKSRRSFPTYGFVPDKKIARSLRYRVDIEKFFRITGSQVFSLGVHWAKVESDQRLIPLSEKLVMGGSRSLRGYRERQFTGQEVAWANTEYALVPSEGSRLFGFVDVGYYSDRKVKTGRVSSFKVGYGVGVRVESRIGSVEVDYGLGEGDGPLEGKIHFGVINRF